MSSDGCRYVDVLADEGRFSVAIIAAEGTHRKCASFPTIQEAFERAQAVALEQNLEVGREGRERDSRGFVVRVLDDASGQLTPGIIWAPDLDQAEAMVRRSLAGTAYTRCILLSVDSNQALQLTVGTANAAVWGLPLTELAQALEQSTLTEALREVLARRVRERWSGVELFELLRYGLSLEHRDASLVLFWQADPSKAADEFSDERLNERLEDKVRCALRDLPG